jgi:putative tricarboxylic transport membrane protein
MTQHSSNSKGLQIGVGAGVVLVAIALGAGAIDISSEAGYAGVGPNFLPWVVAGALLLCGVLLIREAVTGGYRELEEGSGDERANWPGFVWLSVGLLLNAWLITVLGFILSCTLCFVLAVRGFKKAEDRLDLSLGALVKDALIGFAIAAPVFWLFTKLLDINLPGITSTGWL